MVPKSFCLTWQNKLDKPIQQPDTRFGSHDLDVNSKVRYQLIRGGRAPHVIIRDTFYRLDVFVNICVCQTQIVLELLLP